MHVGGISNAPSLPSTAKSPPPGLSDRNGLPPGMAKKLEAGDPLPPGIMRRFPAASAPAPVQDTTAPPPDSSTGTVLDVTA